MNCVDRTLGSQILEPLVPRERRAGVVAPYRFPVNGIPPATGFHPAALPYPLCPFGTSPPDRGSRPPLTRGALGRFSFNSLFFGSGAPAPHNTVCTGRRSCVL